MSTRWWSRLGTVLVDGIVRLLAALELPATVGPFAVDSDEGPTSERRRRAGLRPTAVVDLAYRLADPLAETLADRRIRPNHVTALALVVALLTGLALAGGYTVAGLVLLGVTGTCDLLDGYLARKLDRQSPAGAFFDSFADRIAEGFILGGLAYAGGGGLLTWLAIWALVASLAISYARARGEGLGVDGTVGLMQRPERIAVIMATLLVAVLVGAWPTLDSPQLVVRVTAIGIGLLAVLASGTAVRRAWSIFAELRAGDRSTGEPETPSASSLEPETDSES